MEEKIKRGKYTGYGINCKEPRFMKESSTVKKRRIDELLSADSLKKFNELLDDIDSKLLIERSEFIRLLRKQAHLSAKECELKHPLDGGAFRACIKGRLK